MENTTQRPTNTAEVMAVRAVAGLSMNRGEAEWIEAHRAEFDAAVKRLLCVQ